MSSRGSGGRPVPGMPYQSPAAPYLTPQQEQQQQQQQGFTGGYPPAMQPQPPRFGFQRPPPPVGQIIGSGMFRPPPIDQIPPPPMAPPPSSNSIRPNAPYGSYQFARPSPPAPPHIGSVVPGYGQVPQTLPPPPYGSSQQVPVYGVQAHAGQGIYDQQRMGIGQPPPPPIASYGGPVANLVEDFASLSLSATPAVPGSLPSNAGIIDPKSLPRPIDGTGAPANDRLWATNCHSRYFQLTTNAFPNAHSLAARWHLPLAAVIQPLAEAPSGEEVPVVNFGPSGIIRCRRCRTYINPYAMFTDNGRHWRCTICLLLNEVPADYICGLDENGKRQDANLRPELSQGSVDLVAPTEYMVRPPMPPVYFFLIDVSISAVRTGMLQIAVDTIKSCLDKFPGFPRTQIGFLTFDSSLHFYNLKSSLTQPQMVVVGQLDDPFLPLPDDLLVNLSESRLVVEALLDSLPSIFADNTSIESALGPALQAAMMVMGQLGGKLVVLQSTLPSLGVGRLKLRGEDARIYGTDKEYTLRVPEEQFYKQTAAEFSKLQIGVDMYAFSDKYTDLASLGTLSKYTGGQVYYYPGFQTAFDGEKFAYDLARNISRETTWEAVMRVRCGKGVKYSGFHGHFMLRSSDLLALPAVDCDKTFAVEFVLDDTLLTSQVVYFQVALLYTSSCGERRIRVHTSAVPVVSDLSEMYRAADVNAIMGVMSRLAVEKSMVDKLESGRQLGQQSMMNALREFRNIHAVKQHNQMMGRLVFPESLKHLPLYVLALCKSVALRGGYLEVGVDERSYVGYEIMIMSTLRLRTLLYPHLLRLDERGDGDDDDDDDDDELLPLTMDVLDPRGMFLYWDGMQFVIWVGKLVAPDLVAQTLGSEAARSYDLRKVCVVGGERLKRIIRRKREKNGGAYYEMCVVVRQGDVGDYQGREMKVLLSNLVEDRNFGMCGYMDWMVQIHRQVQQKL